MDTSPEVIYETIHWWFKIVTIRIERNIQDRVFSIRVRGGNSAIKRLVDQKRLPWNFSLSSDSARMRVDYNMNFVHLINCAVYHSYIPNPTF